MNTETNTVAATVTTTEVTKSSKGPGRPKAVLKYPRGSFTFADLYELNRGEVGRGKRAKVCELTVRNHIKASLETGFLTRLEEKVETGKPGQPALRYIRTAVKQAAEARAAARKAEGSNTPNETPVVEISLVEDPVAETAPAVEVPVTA